MDELLDITAVARYLGVSERTVYNRVRSGDLPAVKVGRLWRVRKADLEAWLGGAAHGVGARGGYGASDEASLAAEGGVLPSRADLETALAGVSDQLEHRLLFVGMLARAFATLGWAPPVVVGGHAVEFWTAGGYTTVDIDLVSAHEPFAQVLATWGFVRLGRHFYDDALGIVVEAPGSQLSADEQAHVVAVRARGLTVSVLGIEDLIIDRLNACVHWSHEESCDVARALLLGNADIDWEYLLRRAAEDELTNALDAARRGADST